MNALIILSNVKYNTSNWNIDRFCINEFDGKANVGDHFRSQFIINFQSFEISANKEIEVLQLSNKNRTLSGRFIDLSEPEKKLINHFDDTKESDVTVNKGNKELEGNSRRHHFRIESPASVIIDNVKYNTTDWSKGGFRIVDFNGNAKIGDKKQIQFILCFKDFKISITKEIEVVRLADDGHTLAGQFINFSEQEKELINSFDVTKYNNNTKKKGTTIKREAPSQRRHYRISLPAAVIIDNVRYNTKDWSLGGFCIDEFNGNATVGDNLQIKFVLNFNGYEISINNVIKVVRISADKHTLAGQFTNMSDRETDLLNYFINSFVHGEISSIDDTINRLETPVTPVSAISSKSTDVSDITVRKTNIRRIVYSSIYLIMGSLLMFFLIIVLYGRFFRIDIESAVLTLPIEPIVAQDYGRLKEIYIQEGTNVIIGQALFSIEDDTITWELESNRLRLSAIENELKNANVRKSQELEKLAAYKKITQHKLAEATDLVAALTLQTKSAENELNRTKALFQTKVVSKQVIDEIYAQYANVKGELDKANSELEIAKESVNSVQKGNFYDGDRLVGDLAQITADIDYITKRVDLARQELNMHKQRASRLIYKAPYSGRVLKIFKSTGNTIKKGESLVLLEHSDSVLRVDAFLTQDEIVYVKLDDKVKVAVPALDRIYQAVVVSIDRTSGFINEIQGHYQWRGTEDKSAYVQLVFEKFPQKEKHKLKSGMPAALNISKNFNLINKIFLW